MGVVHETPGRKTAQSQRHRQPKPQFSLATNTDIASSHPDAKKIEVISLIEDSDDEVLVKEEPSSRLNVLPDKCHTSSTSQILDFHRYVFGDQSRQNAPAHSAQPVSFSPERADGWAMTNTTAGRQRRESKVVQTDKDVEYTGNYKFGNQYARNQYGFRVDPDTGGKIEPRPSRAPSKNYQGTGATKKANPKKPRAVKGTGRVSKQSSGRKSRTNGASTSTATMMRNLEETGRYARVGDSMQFFPDSSPNTHGFTYPKEKDDAISTPFKAPGKLGDRSTAVMVPPMPKPNAKPAFVESAYMQSKTIPPPSLVAQPQLQQECVSQPCVKSESRRSANIPTASFEPKFDLEGVPAGHMRRKTERLMRSYPQVSPRYLYDVLVRVNGDYLDAMDAVLLSQVPAPSNSTSSVPQQNLPAKIVEEDVKIKLDLEDHYFTFDDDGVDQAPAYHRY